MRITVALPVGQRNVVEGGRGLPWATGEIDDKVVEDVGVAEREAVRQIHGLEITKRKQKTMRKSTARRGREIANRTAWTRERERETKSAVRCQHEPPKVVDRAVGGGLEKQAGRERLVRRLRLERGEVGSMRSGSSLTTSRRASGRAMTRTPGPRDPEKGRERERGSE